MNPRNRRVATITNMAIIASTTRVPVGKFGVSGWAIYSKCYQRQMVPDVLLYLKLNDRE